MVGTRSSSLRIVFFGSPAFAVPTLEALLASRHRVVGVVTQPDRPRGRGQQVIEGPVKVAARAAGVPVLQPTSLKQAEFGVSFGSFDAELGVVAAYGRLLPEWLLATPRLGMINVHASLLPRYRGAAPIHRAVAAGDRETGVSIMRVVKALDAGPVLATVRRPVALDETSADVERGLATLGAALLAETVDRLSEGPVEEVPQDDRLATYAPRITRDDGAVDWSRSAVAIHNQVRAMVPWPRAYTFLGDRRLILLRTSVVEPSGGMVASLPATVIVARGADLHVATGDGVLAIHELQSEGSRAMATRDFLAGHALAPGTRFSGPPHAPAPAAPVRST